MDSAAAVISHCRRHGMCIIAATSHCDEDLAGTNFSAPHAVAVGNEADGLSHGLLTVFDLCVRIEMFETLESLNFAVTIGIVLHATAVRKLKSDAVETKKIRKAVMQAAAAGTEEELEHEAARSKMHRESTKCAAAAPVKIFTQEIQKKLHSTKQLEALVVMKISTSTAGFLGRGHILIFEEIHDAFNLGTILR